jgi:hypothetical protein
MSWDEAFLDGVNGRGGTALFFSGAVSQCEKQARNAAAEMTGDVFRKLPLAISLGSF